MKKISNNQHKTPLSKRVAFEMSLLEKLYDVTLSSIYSEVKYRPEFAVDGQITTAANMQSCSSSWRDKARVAASPLFFFASFKILDMYVENLLFKRGVTPAKAGDPYSFGFKKTRIPSIKFDDWIEKRQWLKDRIISLYCELIDFRHDIAHRWAYEAHSGGITFLNSKGGIRKEITASELSAFVRIVCCLVRVRMRLMKVRTLQEVRIIQDLNAVAALHNMPTMPACEFAVVTYNSKHDRPTVDLIDCIQAELKKSLNVPEVRFDLVFRACEGTENAETYFFDWEAISRRRYLSKSLARFAMKA